MRPRGKIEILVVKVKMRQNNGCTYILAYMGGLPQRLNELAESLKPFLLTNKRHYHLYILM